MARKTVNYVSNENILREIARSKEILEKSNGKLTVAEALTPELVHIIQLLVHAISTKYNWRSYSYVDEMRSEANLALCKSALKFNAEKSQNPYGYYTQIIFRSFSSYWSKENDLSKIKNALIEECALLPSFSRQAENEEDQDVSIVESISKPNEENPDLELKKEIKRQLDLICDIISQMNNVELLDNLLENLEVMFPEVDHRLALAGDFFEAQKYFPESCFYDFTYNTEYKQILLKITTPSGSSVIKSIGKSVFKLTNDNVDLELAQTLLQNLPKGSYDINHLSSFAEKMIIVGLLAHKDKIYNEHKLITTRLVRTGVVYKK